MSLADLDGFDFYLERASDFDRRGKWPLHVLGLSPRERTGVTSPIFQSEVPVV